MAGKPKAVGGHWVPETCTKRDLSVILDLSIRTLTDLAATGVLVPAPKNGTFLTIPSITAYIQKLRTAAANRADEQRNPLNDERIASERVERQIKELRLAQLKGEVLTVDEVSESWSNFASTVKSAVLTIPSKARTTIPHLTAHDAETIRTLVTDILNDLADEVEASVIGGNPSDVKAKK
jgi:phage terminase Nu1 subunit (DNA packaging protein)